MVPKLKAHALPESAKFELEALSGTCVPQSGDHAKLQPRGTCQAVYTAKDDR